VNALGNIKRHNKAMIKAGKGGKAIEKYRKFF
jgi:hypothetical protein